MVRIARCVKYAVNGHGSVSIFKKYSVGIAAHQGSAILLEYDRVHFWVAASGLQASIDTAQKVFAEAWALPFIPGIGLVKIPFGFLSDD